MRAIDRTWIVAAMLAPGLAVAQRNMPGDDGGGLEWIQGWMWIGIAALILIVVFTVLITGRRTKS